MEGQSAMESINNQQSANNNDDDWEDEFEERRERNLRKIVAFELDDELYGADIEDVAEMMEMVPIMPLPNVSDYILGLINLRGIIVPVIDLRILFHLNRKEPGPDSRIIIMKWDEVLVGIVADRMWELLRLSFEAFQPPPPDVAKIQAEYFKGVSPLNDRMLIVLDIRKILKETANKGNQASKDPGIKEPESLSLETDRRSL